MHIKVSVSIFCCRITSQHKQSSFKRREVTSHSVCASDTLDRAAQQCSLLRSSVGWAGLLPGDPGEESTAKFIQAIGRTQSSLWEDWNPCYSGTWTFLSKPTTMNQILLMLWLSDLPLLPARERPFFSRAPTIDMWPIWLKQDTLPSLRSTSIISAKSILQCNVTYPWDNTKGNGHRANVLPSTASTQLRPVELWGPVSFLHLLTILVPCGPGGGKHMKR